MGYDKFEQGKFFPENKEKYKGTLPIIMRSSYEFKLARFLDKNPFCVKWGSESVVVPYKDPTRGNTVHRYFIDFNAVFKDKEGNFKNFYIELKPFKHTHPPTNHGNKKQKTLITEQIEYSRNIAKWEAARSWAHQKGAEFIVITEKELFAHGIK